jgi:hypothetical protein
VSSSAVLRVVGQQTDPEMLELLVIKSGAAKHVTAIERDVPVPLIGLALHDFYTLGDLIDAGAEYGTQVSARITFLRFGRPQEISGAVVGLVGGPDIVLPLGTLNGQQDLRVVR